MKYVVLTNFNGYDSSINCDKYGVITLTLKPTRIKETRFKCSYLKKKRETGFTDMYCTIYKKNKSSYLYKYTNHLPRNNFKYEKINIVKHRIPINYDLKWVPCEIGLKKRLRNYYFKKSRYYFAKYNSI